MALTGEQVDMSNNIQGTMNLVISLVWVIIYLYSFQYCSCKREQKPDDIRIQARSISFEIEKKSTIVAETESEEKPIIIVTILYPSIYLFRYIIFVISWYIDDNYVESSFKDIVLERIMDGCFVVGNIIFYLSIILRFQNGVKFADYVYIIKLDKISLYVAYGLLAMIFSINSVYYITKDISKTDPNKVHKYVPPHLFWILAVLNLSLGIVLITRFTQKIWQFIRLRNQTTFDNGLTEQQKQFLAIAIKYGLLCGIAIIFTNFQFCGWLLLNFDLIESLQSIFWFDIFWSWLFDVVLFVNFYTIWLSFPFAVNYYECVCSCCHTQCKRILLKQYSNAMPPIDENKTEMSNI